LAIVTPSNAAAASIISFFMGFLLSRTRRGSRKNSFRGVRFRTKQRLKAASVGVLINIGPFKRHSG
jgi:hypothetical protein